MPPVISEDDQQRIEPSFVSPIRSVARKFRNIAKSGVSITHFQKSDLVYSAANIIIQETNQTQDPCSLRHSLRMAERKTEIGIFLGGAIADAIILHPQRMLTVEPLFNLAVEKSIEFKITVMGMKFMQKYLWCAFVAHGCPGARLPDPPDGIYYNITHVPVCHAMRGGQDDGENQGGTTSNHEPGWRR